MMKSSASVTSAQGCAHSAYRDWFLHMPPGGVSRPHVHGPARSVLDRNDWCLEGLFFWRTAGHHVQKCPDPRAVRREANLGLVSKQPTPQSQKEGKSPNDPMTRSLWRWGTRRCIGIRRWSRRGPAADDMMLVLG